MAIYNKELQSLAQVKKGDSFCLDCFYSNDDGIPIPISAIDLYCQIRSSDSGALIDTPIIVKSDQTAIETMGRFVVTQTPDITDKWPVGKLLIDIKFSKSGTVFHTETIALPIIQRVTV